MDRINVTKIYISEACRCGRCASGPTERVPFQVFKDMDAIVKIIGVQVLQYILQAVVLGRQIKKLIKEGER